MADDEPEVDDMFARQAKRQRTLADTQQLEGGFDADADRIYSVAKTQVAGASSSATTSVPFAVRVQQELAEYAQTLRLEKEKRVCMWNIQPLLRALARVTIAAMHRRS